MMKKILKIAALLLVWAAGSVILPRILKTAMDEAESAADQVLSNAGKEKAEKKTSSDSEEA